MNTYTLINSVSAKEGKADELAGILLEVADAITKVQGCQHYTVYRDTAKPNTFWFTEVWDSKEDHDSAVHDDAFREQIMKALPLFDSPPESGAVVEILGGSGLS